MTKLILRAGLIAALAVSFGVSVQAQQVSLPAQLANLAYPDLIIYNGKIVSVDNPSLDNNLGRTYEAMAVKGERIQFLGTTAELLAYAGPNTRKIDLKGRMVIPGIIDSHTHLHNHAYSWWAQNNTEKFAHLAKRISVRGKTYEELNKGIELAIKEGMSGIPKETWADISVPGGTDIGMPYLRSDSLTREMLDQWAPDRPVWVSANVEYKLNTAARDALLNYYGVEPTDENLENAVQHAVTINRTKISDAYFENNVGELANAMEHGMKSAAANGITTFSSHIVGLRFMPAYDMLRKEGRMPIRFGWAHRLCQLVEENVPGCFLHLGPVQSIGDNYYWSVGMTLGAIDGGPPSICTTMEAPPKFKAQEKCFLQPGNQYAKAIHTALANRYRYIVNHVYGDKAVDYVMDIMDQVIEENSEITLDYMRNLRMTSDHCGFYPRKEQLARMARFNWIPSCDVAFINRSYPWLAVYGNDKANRIAPMKSIIDAGLMATLEYELRTEDGTGPTLWSQGIQAITRKNNKGVLVAPEEAISRELALKMITVYPSYYVLKEKEIGTLEVGKLADFVVYNKDYLTIPVEEIPSVFPLLTVVGGKTVVLREEFARELGTQPVGPQVHFEFTEDYDEGEVPMGADGDAANQ
jgi:predicted amidohydrolase YtcJ